MPRRKWTANALASETGIDRRVVTERLSDVKPCEVKKDRNGKETRRYFGRDAFPALYADGSPARVNAKPESVDAADRLKELKVEEAELDLAERRGDLVQAAAVQSAFDAVLLESSARFDAIPQSIADELMSTTDRNAVVRIIENAINGARELFANLRIPLAGPGARMGPERGGGATVAAASNGRDVGGSEPRSIS